MIISFGDKSTEHLYHGKSSKNTRKYPRNIMNSAIIVILTFISINLLNVKTVVQKKSGQPGNKSGGMKKLEGIISAKPSGAEAVVKLKMKERHWKL